MVDAINCKEIVLTLHLLNAYRQLFTPLVCAPFFSGFFSLPIFEFPL